MIFFEKKLLKFSSGVDNAIHTTSEPSVRFNSMNQHFWGQNFKIYHPISFWKRYTSSSMTWLFFFPNQTAMLSYVVYLDYTYILYILSFFRKIQFHFSFLLIDFLSNSLGKCIVKLMDCWKLLGNPLKDAMIY